MISKPLLKQSIKANWVLWVAMTAVMLVLNIQFASLEMTQSLLFLIFYGMLATIIPSVYALLTANKLLASQVDRGSMAYVLSNPAKRSTVVFTQMLYLIGSLILMFALTAAAHTIVNLVTPASMEALGFPELVGNLTTAMILKVNLSALMVSIAVAGICFMCSGIFNLTKYSMGLSGTFVGVTIIANMLAMFGNLGVEFLGNFKYLTIATLYDYTSILGSGNDWIWKLFVALGIAVISFTVGSTWFCKKDLPL